MWQSMEGDETPMLSAADVSELEEAYGAATAGKAKPTFTMLSWELADTMPWGTHLADEARQAHGDEYRSIVMPALVNGVARLITEDEWV